MQGQDRTVSQYPLSYLVLPAKSPAGNTVVNGLVVQPNRPRGTPGGRWYEQNWLGFRVVDHIAKSMLNDTPYNRCSVSDHVLFQLGTLFVQSATCCQVNYIGDVNTDICIICARLSFEN